MGLEYQLNWWHESFSKPMMRYIVEEQSGSKIIEIHLQTHVNRHTKGYPEELENCFYLPILPEWTETEDNPVVLWEHLIKFHWDLLEEIESLGEGIELVKIVHYVASSISSVQAIDLAQAIVAKKAGSRLANWEFYSRHFSNEKLEYSPEHFSIGPLIADKIEELS